MFGALARGGAWLFGKVGTLGKIGLLGGTAVAATDIASEGGVVRGFVNRGMTDFGKASADATSDSTFEGLYKTLENIIKLIQNVVGSGPITNSLMDVALKGQGRGPAIRDAEGNMIGQGPVDPDKPSFLKQDSERAPDERVAARDTAMNNTGETVALGATGVAVAVGARSVPVLASVFAGASGIYDTAGYAMNGEFKKAGVRLLSGTFETVASVFGAPGMAIAVGGREAIESGAESVLGQDAALPDAPLVGAAKGVGNWAYKAFGGNGPSSP